MSKERKGESESHLCTYCPTPATTDDHVPPKCLFSKPRPSTLITVPSCRECNGGAKLDDEYFRLMVTMNRRIDHPDAEAGRYSSVRSLSRTEGRGLFSTFVSTIQDDEVLSPAGLYLGTVPTYGANPPRLCRVARRVTLGLRYHETGQRLQDDYEAIALLPAAVESDDIRNKLLRVARELWWFAQRRVTARNVLSYWWAPIPDNYRASAWLLVFYDRPPFITIIRRRLVMSHAAG